MKKRILDYRKRIDEMLASGSEDICWEQVKEEHLVQIGFFQHERLVHLLVTLTFALLTIGSVFVIIITSYFPLTALTFLLLVLLVPYIMHYYLLENEVQKMYSQYDEILKKI